MTIDFDGASLHALLRRRHDASSVSECLASLHAIATTRVCLDRERPVPNEFFYRGKSDGTWGWLRLFRARGDGAVGADPCRLLSNHRNQSNHTQFTLRRALRALNGSTLRLGRRANAGASRLRHVGRTDDYFLGAFAPDSARWTDTVPAAPPFKYCAGSGVQPPQPPTRRIPGVAVLLADRHANTNIGHAVRDTVFLAHVLQTQRSRRSNASSLVVSTVLVDDRGSLTGNLTDGLHPAFDHRRALIRMLVEGTEPPVHVAYLQEGAHPSRRAFNTDAPWLGARTVCFDAVLQKGLAHAGDWRGAALIRERVYASCGIALDEQSAASDTVLLVSHGLGTRRWHDRAALVDSVSNRSYAEHVVEQSMDGLGICEQARLYARSRVVVAHHGGPVANGIFMRPSALMIEVNRQWVVVDERHTGELEHVYADAGFGGLYASLGVAYIGARVAYGVWPNGFAKPGQTPMYQFYNPDMLIGINASRWTSVLDTADQIVETARSVR